MKTLLLLIMIALLMGGCFSLEREPQPYEAQIAGNTEISRAQAARMLAYVHFDRATINTLQSEIQFADVDAPDWHYNYINAAFISGLMRGTGLAFMPDDPLTVGQAMSILDQFGRIVGPTPPANVQFANVFNSVPGEIALADPATPILRKDWTRQLVDRLERLSRGDLYGVFGMGRKNLIMLHVYDDWVATDNGTFGFAGLDLSPYVDMEISVLYRDAQILDVLDVVNPEPILRNVFIYATYSFPDPTICIFAGGRTRTFSHHHFVPLPGGQIGDVRITRGTSWPAHANQGITATAVEIDMHSQKLSGTVSRVTPEFIQMRDGLPIPLAPDMRVYDLSNGEVVLVDLSRIVVGSDVTEFVLCREGYVRAALISDVPHPNNMRVLLSTTGFTGHRHRDVALSSNVPFTVWASGVPFVHAPGEVFRASRALDIFEDSRRVYVTMNQYNGRIELLSVERRGQNPRYRGHMEIALEPDGTFTIVNELPMEHYLFAVKPAESLHLEMAKTQAVVARSFAFNQFHTNRFHMYGANVDDSVQSQVYNNFGESELSIAAVNLTAGLGLVHQGRVLAPNFFATSAGVTAASGEVWADPNTRQFPANSEPFLESVRLYTDADFGDLRICENAEIFLRNWSVMAHDSVFPWFRWTVDVPVAALAASINAALPALHAANPALIQTLQPNGAFRSRPAPHIGDLLDIDVLARGEGGNVMSLLIIGSEDTVLVHTDQNIRQVLSPGSIPITRHAGPPAALAQLPSSFFVMDRHFDQSYALASVTFYGGGHGHGAGMSLNAATAMAQAGFGFTEILMYYYGGAFLERIW